MVVREERAGVYVTNLSPVCIALLAYSDVRATVRGGVEVQARRNYGL